MIEEPDMNELIEAFYNEFGSLDSLDKLKKFSDALGYKPTYFNDAVSNMLENNPGIGEGIFDFFVQFADEEMHENLKNFLAEHG